MTESEYVLVRGVVYRWLDLSARPLSNPKPKWYRRSVPPDFTPGKRSKWPASYRNQRLPEHKAINDVQAREIIGTSLRRLLDADPATTKEALS